ncbi:MAG: beta strand repeat-containing protein, partial [Verrucomicrobiota bacterium]
GDGIEQTSSSGSSSSGTIDFTSGTVDALVDTIIVGRAGGGPGTGTLTFDGGTVDVNTLHLGVETTALAKAGVGTVNVNGTGHLLVNGDLVMGSGGVGGTATHGVVNIGTISGGSVTVNGNVVCVSGSGNIISSFGDLTLGGQLGTDGITEAPLETLELWAGSLTFDLGVAGNPVSARAYVTNLNVNGAVTLNVQGQGLSIGQFPLIKYFSGLGDVGGFSGFSGFTLTLPGNVEGYLLNNTANASVDLVITNITTKKWSGLANSDWDINTTTNWLKFPPGTSAKYLETSVPGDAVTFDDTAAGTTTVYLTTTLSPAGILVSNVTKTYTFNGTGTLSGPTSLIKQGSGTLILGSSGVNDFTDPVIIEGGTVRLSGSADRVPTNGTVTLADVAGATFDLNGVNQALAALDGGGLIGGNVTLGTGDLTIIGDGGNYAGVISGAGKIIKDGSGAQVLSGANLQTGGARVVAGTLTVANTTGSGTGPGSVSVESTNAILRIGDGGANGSLAVSTISNEGLVVLNRSDDFTFDTLITGGGSFRKENTNNVVTITIANTYTNGTAIMGGGLRISNAGALGDTTGSTFIGNDATARLELTGNLTLLEPIRISQKQTAAGNVPGVLNISGINTLAGPIELPAGGSYWTVQSAAGNLIVSGPITNTTTSNVRTLWLSGAGDGEWNTDLPNGVGSTGALRKDGTGTWKIGSTVTYTGPTVVSNGTLLVNGAIMASSAVTVSGGSLGGNGAISVPVTVGTLGTLAPGDGGIGKLSVFNSLTLSGTTTVELNKSGATVTNDQVSVLTTLTQGGTLNVTLTGTVTGGEVFTLFTAGTFTGAFDTINLPALPGTLTWDTSNLAVNGTLAISGSAQPTLNFSQAAGVLTLSWAEAGYKLQAQTNTLAVGLSSNWADYPNG